MFYKQNILIYQNHLYLITLLTNTLMTTLSKCINTISFITYNTLLNKNFYYFFIPLKIPNKSKMLEDNTHATAIKDFYIIHPFYLKSKQLENNYIARY